MKKFLKSLLICLLPLSLASCSFFGGNEDINKNKLNIPYASFSATYQTIIFNFPKLENASFYSVYFSGASTASISKVEPKVTYDLPSLPDGKYSVGLKAFAKSGYEDSDLFDMGEFNKVKEAKNNESLSLTATLENRKISVEVKNLVESDKTPITVIIKKNGEIFQTEKNIVLQKKFSTATLSSGSYEVSAFFQETNETAPSSEVILDAIMVEKEKINVKDLNVNYSFGILKLDWFQNENLRNYYDATLSIAKDTETNFFTEKIQGKRIQPGITIDASEFGIGELKIDLQFIVKQDFEKEYESSNILSATIQVSKIQYETPELQISLNENTGDLTLNCTTIANEKFNLTIEKDPFDTSSSFSSDQYFNFSGRDVKFPLTFSKVNENWTHANYLFSLQRVSDSTLVENSQIYTQTKKIESLLLKPNIEIKREENPATSGGGIKFTFTAHTPEWIASNDWTEGKFSYRISLAGCGDGIRHYSLENEGDEKALIFPEKVLAGYYHLDVFCDSKIYNYNVPYGYSLESINVEEFELFDSGYGFPLISIASVIRGKLPYRILPKDIGYNVKFNKNYPFLDFHIIAEYTLYDEEGSAEFDYNFNEEYDEYDLFVGECDLWFYVPLDAKVHKVTLDAYIGDECDSDIFLMEE